MGHRHGAPRSPTRASPAKPARPSPTATPGLSAYTGNYTAAVWYGNDDFSPTEKLTGGILPAMTFQRFMSYAHQNLDLKPIPGLEKPFPDAVPESKEPKVAEGSEPGEGLKAPERPAALTSRTTKVLKELNALFKDAPPLGV